MPRQLRPLSECVLCLVLAACTPPNPTDGRIPAAAPPVAPAPVSAPVSVTLPPDVASITDPHSLAEHRQRAWIARYGPIRFAPTAPIAQETADLNERANNVDEPEIVIDARANQARIVTGKRGLRILVWIPFADLVSVPVRIVALRTSAGKQGKFHYEYIGGKRLTVIDPVDDANAVRVYPGFRFTSVDRRDDDFEVHYKGQLAQFDGFLDSHDFGVVFEPAELAWPPPGTESRARSNATIVDRPNGQVIATLRGTQPPYFEHEVFVVGEPQHGFTPIMITSPPADESSRAVTRYLIRGWVRSADLGMDEMPHSAYGSISGGIPDSQRSRLVTIAAGTPLRRVPSGPIIGAAVESGTHPADPAPGGGYWVDVYCPWGALQVYVSEARELGA